MSFAEFHDSVIVSLTIHDDNISLGFAPLVVHMRETWQEDIGKIHGYKARIDLSEVSKTEITLTLEDQIDIWTGSLYSQQCRERELPNVNDTHTDVKLNLQCINGGVLTVHAGRATFILEEPPLYVERGPSETPRT